jgi:hypothetical protein
MGKKIGLEAIRHLSRKEAAKFFDCQERSQRVVLAKEDMNDGRLHAIMVIAPSSTGRTTYIEKNFLGFKVIDVSKIVKNDEDYEYQELVQKLESSRDAGINIALEGNFFDLGVRAFILNTLNRLGYTTHICLFSYRVLMKRLGRVCLAKAKEIMQKTGLHYVYQDQLEYMRVISNLSKLLAKDAALELTENFKFQYDHDFYTLGCESFEFVKTVV